MGIMNTILELWSHVRRTDPVTSLKSARDNKSKVSWGSQRHKILVCYSMNSNLTDEEAGKESGLIANRSCCYWKRCSELRQMGLIAATGDTRFSDAGKEQSVSEITAKGLSLLLVLNNNPRTK